jgi:hypothetical protein
MDQARRVLAVAARKQKENEREKSRKEDRYLELLRDYSKQKDITVESVWGAGVEALLASHSAYKALEAGEREALFVSFIAKLVLKKKVCASPVYCT